MRTASLLLLTACVSAGSAQEPAKVAVVRTWGDLAGQPPLTVSTPRKQVTQKIRIGLEAREVTRNSAILVYALLEGTRWTSQGSALGPLQVELFPENQPRERRKSDPRDFELSEKGPRQLLFMAALPVGAPGKYSLVLRGSDDAIVATGTVVVADKAPEPWLAFGHPHQLREQFAVRDDIAREINLSLQNGVPALPDCDGHFPVMARPEGGKEVKPTYPLPRWSFDQPDPRLKLQADLKMLRVETEMKLDVNYARLHWLCRVWVNGKPFVPESRKERPLQELTRPLAHVDHWKLHLEWDLDPKQIGAKKGDRIAVQLLHSWDGWQIVSTDHLGWTNDGKGLDWYKKRPRLPLLTNKAEFICP